MPGACAGGPQLPALLPRPYQDACVHWLSFHCFARSISWPSLNWVELWGTRLPGFRIGRDRLAHSGLQRSKKVLTIPSPLQANWDTLLPHAACLLRGAGSVAGGHRLRQPLPSSLPRGSCSARPATGSPGPQGLTQPTRRPPARWERKRSNHGPHVHQAVRAGEPDSSAGRRSAPHTPPAPPLRLPVPSLPLL